MLACRSRCPNRRNTRNGCPPCSAFYLIYNEGYSASSGQRWIRDELCSEALRLGRALAALVPDEAEVYGLVGLMEFQSSRFAARTDAERPLVEHVHQGIDTLAGNLAHTAIARVDVLAETDRVVW